MRKVITKDGSVSYYSEEYDEGYHSLTGAHEEARKKFVEPCCIRKGMRILDVCFGIGYNTLAAVERAKKLEIIGLEKDREIIEKIKELDVPDFMKEIAERLKYEDEELKIKIIIGDAREKIKDVKGEFDAVFLDPFSPKKNPELWEYEFLKEIGKKMKKEARLATYSCARAVRENLKKAGFEVRNGPCVGRKSPSTIAIKK